MRAPSQLMRKNRSLFLYAFAPAPLILLSWTLVFLGVTYGYIKRDELMVLSRTMQLNGVEFGFPLEGIAWISVCLLVVSVLGSATIRPLPRSIRSLGNPNDLSLAISLAALTQIVVVLVVILWITLGAISVGGFGQLIAMAAEQETVAAREAILENKLFPGMRLVYTTLISFGLFGAGVFVANINSSHKIRRDMKLGVGMFLLSVVVLAMLPIFLSQRILLVHMILSTFIASSIIAGRPLRLRFGLIFAILLFSVWSFREAVTVGEWASEYTNMRIGAEKLIYYFVNDFHNAVVPFSEDFEHTYGVYTFKFAVYLSGTEDIIGSAFRERIGAVEAFRAGGAFPAFTAHYVDFSWMGAIFLAGLMVVFTWVFNAAQRSFTVALIYGQIGSALILSPHTPWYSHHNFVFNVLVILLIGALIRRTQNAKARKIGTAPIATT